jgi:hypothetical protein
MDVETFRLFAAATLALPAIFYVGFVNVLAVPPNSRIAAAIVAILLAMGAWGYFTRDIHPL